jgi:sulfite reductase (NADPH) flavoprotein alpha-component
MVPFLPDHSPFSAEQRAYLNGFFAGLFSKVAVSSTPTGCPPSAPLQSLTILFGSQTGTCESLAKKAATEAGKCGFAPSLIDLGEYTADSLVKEERVLVVTSTYGDGEPPDNAKAFWKCVNEESFPMLSRLRFAILGLGDTNYPKFCQFAKDLDQRFEMLGATRVHPRIDCDLEYEEPSARWIAEVMGLMAGERKLKATVGNLSGNSVAVPSEETGGWSKRNPFPARLLLNRRLNSPGSGKDTRHFEICLADSGLSYEAGDALGVVPRNCPDTVEELIRAGGFYSDERVLLKSGETTLRAALTEHLEIQKISKPLLEEFARRSGEAALSEVVSPEANGSLTRFLHGRYVLDLFIQYPKAGLSAQEFVGLLSSLQPRLYSISSSPKKVGSQVHLTVSAVRYESLGRKRKGVCSTFLADRVDEKVRVPVYVHANKAFRLPADASLPLIMVGPGTGIAPFRAFLQDREASGAKGKNWLFFGDQKSSTDFLYREELEAWNKKGLLTRLDTAFSRDQTEKVYVQTRMQENARELYDWLEEGGCLYVCGDASRMAKDVDESLHKLIEDIGGKTRDAACEYVENLWRRKRYLRDVY